MAQDRPTASELLLAIADILREEVTPALDRVEPRLGYQMRVAANALAILERETRLGPDADARELARDIALGVGNFVAPWQRLAERQRPQRSSERPPWKHALKMRPLRVGKADFQNVLAAGIHGRSRREHPPCERRVACGHTTMLAIGVFSVEAITDAPRR